MKALEGKKTQKLEKVKNFFKFWSAGQLDALFWGLLSFLKLFILKTNINVSVIRRNYAKKFRKKYFIFVTLSATEENNRIRIRNQWQCCVVGIVLIPIRIRLSILMPNQIRTRILQVINKLENLEKFCFDCYSQSQQWQFTLFCLYRQCAQV